MILDSVKLENFGLYAGSVAFPLRPTVKGGTSQPIVLIGGKNGVGKTTLLDAVRLALYGKRSLGARIGQSDYEEHLRAKIHRSSTRPPASGAAIELDFDFAEDGVVFHYTVRRSWAARGRSLVETLVLKRNGQVFDDLTPEEWQDFLYDLIPLGVSQLFFFDGERIGELAEGDHDEEHLAAAIRGLLGIDLIGRLRTDLGLFLARHNRSSGSVSTSSLRTVLEKLDSLDDQLSKLNEEASELSARRDGEARASDQLRRRFVNEGGEVAAQRIHLVSERESLERQVARLLNELRESVNDLLPFTVAPTLTRNFEKSLRDKADTEQKAARSLLAEDFRSELQRWRVDASPPRSCEWTESHWNDLEVFLKSWQPTAATIAPGFDPIAGTARRSIIAVLENLEASTRPRAIHLATELDELEQRLTAVSALLLRAEGENTHLLLDELRIAEQRVGATQAILEEREEDLKRLRAERTALEREKSKLLEEHATQAMSGQRATLAVKASRALAEYERELLVRKVQTLRGEFVRCFNHLIRKDDFVADALIDADTFTVTLRDGKGAEIPKATLSAGEKQIYAIALLWALARTSGRALPMIIDTPLGRLDSEHRSNLVERYFPFASHQVILLSTDVEVDSTLMERLAPYVSHAFELEYDSPTGRSFVKAGYFADEKSTEFHGTLVSAIQ